MKIALITTTINVPYVLELYRKLRPPTNSMQYFVAGDENTRVDPVEHRFIQNYLSPEYQKSLGYKCSELIGWNNDSRRNIALLEAVKWGADIIVSVDDDMIPMGSNFFARIEETLTTSYSGLCFGASAQWFDAGQFTIPGISQRGLPIWRTEQQNPSFVIDAQIGAMQGTILGIPDTDACSMAVMKPYLATASDVLRTGFVVDPDAKSVFNSQFTAFRRELAPAFAQFYKWQGRNTDIFASLIMRRVMRERNLYTHFGPPMGFHARTYRDPLKDLKAEMWGLENVADAAAHLDVHKFKSTTVVDQVREIFMNGVIPWEGHGCCDAAQAFLDDMEGVL